MNEHATENRTAELSWISKRTAMDIALAYREIETAEALLAQVREANRHRVAPDIRDDFGRPPGGLQLGVPSGSAGHRLFNVPWTLAEPIIEAHIANQRAVVAALCVRAKAELASADVEAQ